MRTARTVAVIGCLLILAPACVGTDPFVTPSIPQQGAATSEVTRAQAGSGPSASPVSVLPGPTLSKRGEVPIQVGIHLFNDPTGPSVPATLIGTNLRWVDSDRYWDAASNAPVPQFFQRAVETHLGITRYPAGSRARLFNWKAAIGPESQRGCQIDGITGVPQSSVYGPDEHMKLVHRAGMATTYVVPPSRGPRSAANLVEYMNAKVGANPNGGKDWARVRAQNGHHAPYHVKWWEIGNEPELHRDRYWRAEGVGKALRQYVFGGMERQVRQRVGTECDQRETASISKGSRYQTFYVLHPPVKPGSERIFVDGRQWHEVRNLHQSPPSARVYEFHPEDGRITFGNGRHGRVPPSGAKITATYVSGPHAGYLGFYRAMKRVDPAISVCSSWESVAFIDLMGNRHPYDCLVAHLLSLPRSSKLRTSNKLYDWLISAADDQTAYLRRLQREIRRQRSSEHLPRIIVTESGAYTPSGSMAGVAHWESSVSSAVHDASLLVAYVRDSIPVAMIRNIGLTLAFPPYPGGRQATHFPTARSQVLDLFAGLVGGRPVPTRVEVTDGGRLALDYPPVKAVGTRRQRGVYRIAVVNRDRTRPIRVTVDAPGLSGRVRMTSSTLCGPSIAAANVPGSPSSVVTTRETQVLPASEMSVVLPPHSVSIVAVGDT